MNQILIVSKTHLHNGACVGGLELNTNRNIRLMSPGDHCYQPTDTPFEVGDIWNIQYTPHHTISHPHYEDVIVQRSEYQFTGTDVGQLLQERGLINWENHVDNLFDGLLKWTGSGSAYIPQNGPFPNRSVGFWRTNKDLTKKQFDNRKIRYSYPNGNSYRNISYVGFQEPINIIEAGTIIRVSLSRIFPRPGTHEIQNVPHGYYLQLSGWYPNQIKTMLATPTAFDEAIDDLPF